MKDLFFDATKMALRYCGLPYLAIIIGFLYKEFEDGFQNFLSHSLNGLKFAFYSHMFFTLIFMGVLHLANKEGKKFIDELTDKHNLNEEKEEENKVKKIEEDGVSDLVLASAEGNLERVKDLVAYGANVNATSYNGSTSLMYAARNNRLSIVKFLIENGADREVKNEKKSTALSLSESFKSNEVNEYLKSLSSKR